MAKIEVDRAVHLLQTQGWIVRADRLGKFALPVKAETRAVPWSALTSHP
jgi:DNA-binding GntR family transcriptional regulator